MVSIIMKLYSTIVLTMNTGKYPICVCLCYWPWAQSQANVTPMLLHRDAITQDWSVCQSNELCRTHWRGRQLNEKCHNFTEFQSGKGQLIFSKLHKTTLSTYRNNVAVNTLWKYSYMRGLGEVLQVPPFPPPPLLHPFSFFILLSLQLGPPQTGWGHPTCGHHCSLSPMREWGSKWRATWLHHFYYKQLRSFQLLLPIASNSAAAPRLLQLVISTNYI